MFKFTLQIVLEVRERFEKIKYKEYSAELLIKQELENERADHLAALRRAGQNADHARTTTRIAAPLQFHDHFRQRIQELIVVLDKRLREQDEKVEVKRKELVEARRSHKALEILREKEFGRYQSDAVRLERAVMDETASNYHVYRR